MKLIKADVALDALQNWLGKWLLDLDVKMRSILVVVLCGKSVDKSCKYTICDSC